MRTQSIAPLITAVQPKTIKRSDFAPTTNHVAPVQAPPVTQTPPPLLETIRRKLPHLLLTWDELPHWARDNEFIHTGFRPASNSYLTSLRSLGYIHNQTGNIYSHLLAALGMSFLGLSLLRYAQLHYPSASKEDGVVFGVFFAGMVGCYAASASFHTFGNHSRDGHGLWLRLDFLGIVAVTAGAFVPSLWYAGGNACWGREMRVSWITLDLCCQILGAIFTLFVPRFRTPAWRPFRAGMFVFMASSGFYPIIYATYAHGLRRTVVEGGALYHMLAALFYSSGAVIYAIRWPEKGNPGKYDIWGHSHQLFHVLVVLGLGAHLVAFLVAFDHHHRVGHC